MFLANSNIVIVAKAFNPSIISQIWLVDNGLVAREDFRPGCIFTDVIANVNTKDFQMLTAAEQLQFTPLGPEDQHLSIVNDVLRKIVETLPHTPYRAVGLNLNWHEEDPPGGICRATKRLFFKEESGLFDLFASEDSRFGGYMSKDVFGCRLKLDIKPVIVPKENEQKELLQLAFNFHSDLKDVANPITGIYGLLNHWNDAKDLSMSIVKEVEKGLANG